MDQKAISIEKEELNRDYILVQGRFDGLDTNGLSGVFYVPYGEVAKFGSDHPVFEEVFEELADSLGGDHELVRRTVNRETLVKVTEAWARRQRGEYAPGEREEDLKLMREIEAHREMTDK